MRVAEPEVLCELHACRAVAISNGLYGNYVMSSLELVKGFSKPVGGGGVHAVPGDVVDAHEHLQVRRKLVLILKSNSTQDENASTGDRIEIYSNTSMSKTGT